jgi:hypothetical protein
MAAAAHARARARHCAGHHTATTPLAPALTVSWRTRLRACAAAERDVTDLDHPIDATPTTRRATLAALAAAAATAALARAPAAWAAAAATTTTRQALVAVPTAPFSFLQPGPVAVPRRTLDLRFAVLLMRSVYDAVDGCDVLAMRDFQVSFWKLREGAAEAYAQLISPLEARKGDLSDPNYFDFISYASAAAADAALRGHPPRVFEEEYDECELKDDQDECPILTRVVRRDAPADDADLPAEFWRRAGDLIYGGLAGGFRGETFAGVPAPLPAGASADDVVAGFRAMLGALVASGYALRSGVEVVSAATTGGGQGEGQGRGRGQGQQQQQLELRVTLEGAATQWGSAALASRRSKVMTLHEAAALDGWLRAAAAAGAAPPSGGGWRAVSVEAEFGDASRATTWRLVRGGGNEV